MAYVSTLNDGFNILTMTAILSSQGIDAAYNYAAQYDLSSDEQAAISLLGQQFGVNIPIPPPKTPSATPAAPVTPTGNTTPVPVVKSTPVPTPVTPATTLNPPPLAPSTTPVPATASTTGVVATIKSHKVAVSIGLGALTWFMSKSWVAAGAVAGGTYLVTDKVL